MTKELVLVAKQKYKEVLGRQKTVCSNVETQTEEDIRETQPDTVKVTSVAADSELKEEERQSNFDDEDDIKTMYAVRSFRDKKLPGVQQGAGKKRTIKRTVKWIPY